MELEWKTCHLNVPLNEAGIIEHDTFDEKMPNVISYSLTADDYYAIDNIVFTEWNKKFSIIIDIFEEETLEAEHTREALELLNKHISESNDDRFLAAARKLKEALSKAVELNMPLYLDF